MQNQNHNERKLVRVLDRHWYTSSYVGVTVRAIELDWKCPKCGVERGTVREISHPEDRDWLSIDAWDNPCGHIDKYKDCLVESGFYTKEQLLK